MKQMMLIAAATLTATAAGCAPPPTQPAQQQAMQAQLDLPPGRVYSWHSAAQAGCPALDWHLVLQAGGVLDGMISWNNMQSFARASGGVNMQTGAFQMNAAEVGGQGRTATIDGTVNPRSGWLTANIHGQNVSCQGVQVPWWTPPPTK
jgi:hypothetical protein